MNKTKPDMVKIAIACFFLAIIAIWGTSTIWNGITDLCHQSSTVYSRSSSGPRPWVTYTGWRAAYESYLKVAGGTILILPLPYVLSQRLAGREKYKRYFCVFFAFLLIVIVVCILAMVCWEWSG